MIRSSNLSCQHLNLFQGTWSLQRRIPYSLRLTSKKLFNAYDFKDDGTLSQWLADNPYSDDKATVEVTNCITVLESPPVQDLCSSQMEAEQEQGSVISNSTPTQEGHFSNGAAQRIWIYNSEEDVPNQRGEILVALSKTRYSYNPADDTIIFRPWLNYLDEKDREASRWMKEEVEGASADEEDGGSP
jgi:hypothetical protein